MKRVFWAAGVAAVTLFYFFIHSALAVDGFGQNTTGGAGGTVVTVTTAADLATYVGIINTPYIIQVSGTIDLSSIGGKISIRSNKTIKGIGESPTIIGDISFKKGSSNVIIERLTITNPGGYGEGDGIGVKEDINNVFITKCTIYNCDDGCLDITRSTDNVTVSWCKFYYTYDTGHNYVNLIGSSYPAPDDIGKLHVTFHHNWWGSMCIERMLSVRYGRAHIYNNYYSCTGNNYCVRSRVDAECRIENNYFDHVKDPYLYYPEETPLGRIWASGNVLDNCTWANPVPPGDEVVFTPPYSYMLDDANDIPTMVQLGAGADGIDFFPHWLFGFYGDFDRSGMVDMNDLATFADYWLIDDCDAIADADYYPDCIVNFSEFALMAENWMQ